MATNDKNDNASNKNDSLSEAEKFLESLNLSSESQPDASTAKAPSASSTTDHKEIMSFLDEIAQYPGAPADNTTATTGAASKQEQQQQQQQASTTTTRDESTSNNDASAAAADSNNGGGWMAWGNNLWSQAVKTTTEQINKSGVELPSTAKLLEDRVKQFVNKENLGKLGSELRNLTTTLLETVAPPISEHELVEVFLSHDMVGYVGLEALVYRAFARVMEQTESGHVVVRKVGDKEEEEPTTTRNLNLCEGLVEGTKLAKANLDHLIKTHYKAPEQKTTYTPQSGAVPVINCPVFLAIQPVTLQDPEDGPQVIYIVLLVDPTHQLRFKTYSQSMPQSWLDVPYEESEWVEDKMVEMIRMAVTTIAQDYVYTRMTGAEKEMARMAAAHQQQQAASSSSPAAPAEETPSTAENASKDEQPEKKK